MQVILYVDQSQCHLNLTEHGNTEKGLIFWIKLQPLASHASFKNTFQITFMVFNKIRYSMKCQTYL